MKRFMVIILLVLVSFSFAEPNVSSKFGINLYGFVRFESIYDNTEVAKGDWLLFARPGGTDYADQSAFTMTARHSRVGMKLAGPALENDGKVTGLVEMDFAGGFPNSSTAARQPIPRLRHAWVEVDYPAWSLRFGQDWALISGPFPNTTSFVVGAGKGHLWMRYPQVKYTLKGDATKLSISLNRPMAGNIKYEDFAGGDFDPVGDGEKTGLPWVMARGWLTMGNAQVSVAGHYGQEQIADLANNAHDLNTFSVLADVSLKAGPLALYAKGWMGENLNSFFGGVFQGFVTSENAVENVAAMGGWAQAVYTINPKWSATVGGGMDDPDDEDLTGDMRTQNQCFFGNVGYKLDSSVIFMLEAEYLKTSYLVSEAGDNLRLQFVTYFKF